MADQDVDLDALLREALAVEPTAAFLPRVRQQIAEPAPRRWRWTWLVPAAAAATLVLAAALPSDVPVHSPPTFRATAGKRTADRELPSFALRATEGKRTADGGAPTFAPRATAGKRTADPGPRSTVHDPRPTVLIDQRQRDALLSFMRLVDGGGLPNDAFRHTTAAPVDVAEDVFEIQPIPVAVSPIVVGGVLHFDVGRN